MPIIRITKQVVEDAKKAREAALKKDPDFRRSEEKREKEEKEAIGRLGDHPNIVAIFEFVYIAVSRSRQRQSLVV